jgi:CcmD family protein
MIKKNILSLLFLLGALMGKAQDAAAAPQMADALRDNGKIYVVISVIAIIFIAIVCFLVYLERKLKKLEQQVKNK